MIRAQRATTSSSFKLDSRDVKTASQITTAEVTGPAADCSSINDGLSSDEAAYRISCQVE